MEIRDKAIDGTKGFNMGERVHAPVTPEQKAEELACINASIQVDHPAYLYNEHVKVCSVCSIDRPRGRYSIPVSEA
jgi:hypothetical protein